MKRLAFFILGIFIFWPLHLIMVFVYGSTTSAEPGWYQELWERGFFARCLSVLIGIIMFPLVWFMRIFYSMWEELGD